MADVDLMRASLREDYLKVPIGDFETPRRLTGSKGLSQSNRQIVGQHP